MKKALSSLLFVALLLAGLCSCHCDHKPKVLNIAVGDILCADGSFVKLNKISQATAAPVAVVFYSNKSGDAEGLGYAVWLTDVGVGEFADIIGVEQGTSANTTAYDGNANTFALFTADGCQSPMAIGVFDMWAHGQSAYIPSVAQMRLLYRSRDIINPIIEAVGGQSIPIDGKNCWYWTSTEVDGQQSHKAWLYSLGAGTSQETPKDERHKVRPIITIND